MAIYRRDHLQPYLEELETYYQALRRVVEGEPPSSGIAEQYHASPEQFETEFREVDFDRILVQIDHFKVCVNMLKQLKQKKQTPVGR